MARQKVIEVIGVEICNFRRKKDPRYIVIDMDTGQTGFLQERGGYVMSGGGYVNPSWEPVFFDPEDDIQDDE